MLVGCYTLDLYCDNFKAIEHKFGDFPQQYTDEFGSACRRLAREDGWLIKSDKQLCPKCSNKKEKK